MGESMAKIVKFVYFVIIFASPFVVANHEISGWITELPFGMCTSILDCPMDSCTHPQQPWCELHGVPILYHGSEIGLCICI